ncbi:MAG: NAD(P)H-dependent oxidoreductase subunit E [Armatimonadetes bacterium]|nr:NAD(P)H-dependent oxidoreductase subunit E [Armatimonadota bacterium]
MPFYRAHVLVCCGNTCEMRGGRALLQLLTEQVQQSGLADEIRVVETGCLGVSDHGPAMVVYPEGIIYAGVQRSDIAEIVSEHLLKGRVVQRLVYTGPQAPPVEPEARVSYFGKQRKIVLKNCGVINPRSIQEYIAVGGYEALGKALTQMTPMQTVEEIKDSGLRGRGGAAFPTGLKWEFVADAPGTERVVVCNADEGEPGNFKDRLILEGDPHKVLEAMVISGYAVGARRGYVYIRGEYRQSVDNFENAIAEARQMGLLGENIFDSGFAFDIFVYKGAGAYVCGEETALIESLEGHRGEPRLKPPFPVTHGLWGMPTLVNNVETLANVPSIIQEGADWYRSIGTEQSKGTKIFSPCGDVLTPGVIEVPYGITVREVLYDIAGGPRGAADIKGVMVGGPSGIVIGQESFDRAFAFEDLSPGAGALIVFDETRCIVDIVANVAQFFAHESCGQCVPCREGGRRLLDILNGWTKGVGVASELDLVDSLGVGLRMASRCGLGQFAPVALLSSMELFREEFQSHVLDRHCPTGVCDMTSAVTDEQEQLSWLR